MIHVMIYTHMLDNLTILSWLVTKVLGDMPEVFSFVQEIEEQGQKCDLCKKVMKIFADELDKDDVSFQNYLFYLFIWNIKFNSVIAKWFYTNQRNVVLQNDSSYVGFFFISGYNS